MKSYVLACDLKNDPKLIGDYIEHHKKVWPEIIHSIKKSGIQNMKIFNSGNRLVMIIETNADFSFEDKDKMDRNNDKVQKWEELMWKYQQRIPAAEAEKKWVLMDKIFSLNE
jgi:L-rhamnose mutarotase